MSSLLVVCETNRPLDPICQHLTNDGHILQMISCEASGTYLSNVPPVDLIVMVATESHGWVLGLLADYRHVGGQSPVLVVCHVESGLTNKKVIDAGGDAVVLNRYDGREVTARIKSLIDRRYALVDDVYVFKQLIVDPVKNQIWCHDNCLTLGKKESIILQFLLDHAGQYFTCAQLIERLILPEGGGSEYSIRTLIMKLRRKMKDLGAESIIKSRYGSGYCIEHANLQRRSETLDRLNS